MPIKTFHVPNFLQSEDPKALLVDLFGYLAQTGRFFRFNDQAIYVTENGECHHVRPTRALSFLIAHSILLPVDEIQMDGDGKLHYIRTRNTPGLDATSAQLARALESPDYLRLLPEIRQIVRAPTFRARRERFEEMAAGWDAGGRTLVVGRRAEAGVAADPTCPHLRQAFSGALYLDPIHLSNLIGYVVAGFSRVWIDGFPHLLLDAISQSSGKTTVAQAVGLLLTGELPEPIGYSSGDRDLETKLGQFCNRPGPAYILFDNVRTQAEYSLLTSQVLARLTGSRKNKIRHLYSEGSPLFAPILAMSMNGSATDTDLADKVVSIRFCLPPGVRHRLLDPHPIRYVEEHRDEILAEVASLYSRMRPDWAPAGGHGFRWYDFERVAVQATEIMGLEPVANYSPAGMQTVDAFTYQVVDLMVHRFARPEGVGAEEVILAAQGAAHDLYAINRYLTKEYHGAREARPRRFAEKVQRTACDPVRIGGVTYQVAVREGRLYLEVRK